MNENPKQRGQTFSSCDQGNQRKNQLLLTFLPFTKKLIHLLSLSTGWGPLNSRHLRLRGHCQLSLPCNLTNTPLPKEMKSANGEGPSLELSTESSWHKPPAYIIMKMQTTILSKSHPNTCVQEHRGRHSGYRLGARDGRVSCGVTSELLSLSPT